MIEADPEKTAQIDAQAREIRALIAKAPPPTEAIRRRAAAVIAASLSASGVNIPAPQPEPPASVSTPLPGFRRALGLLVACALLMGCVPVEAIEQCDTEAAALHGLAVAEGNAADVRAVAARGTLAWRAQRRALTGDDVPGAEQWPPIPEQYLPPAQAPR